MSRRYGGRRCCVPGCFSSTYSTQNVSFSPFPSDEALRTEWISIINANTSEAESAESVKRPWSTPVRKVLGSKHQSVCGLHFNLNGQNMFCDKKPKYFYHKDERTELIPERFIDVSNCVEIPSPNMDKVDSNLLPISRQIAINPAISQPTNDHNYSLNQDDGELRKTITTQQRNIDKLISMVDQIGNLTQENLVLKQQKACTDKQISQLNEKVKKFHLAEIEISKLKENLDTLTHALTNENRNLKLEIHTLKEEAKLKDTRFSLSCIINSAMLQFYTGFQSMEDFNDLYEYIELDLPNLNFYHSRGYERQTERKDHKNRGRPMTLNFKDQLLLVLCRLKVGLFEQDLAYRFEISVKTVSNICITWFDLLDKRITRLKIWPSRKLVDEDMPDIFKTMYNRQQKKDLRGKCTPATRTAGNGTNAIPGGSSGTHWGHPPTNNTSYACTA